MESILSETGQRLNSSNVRREWSNCTGLYLRIEIGVFVQNFRLDIISMNFSGALDEMIDYCKARRFISFSWHIGEHCPDVLFVSINEILEPSSRLLLTSIQSLWPLARANACSAKFLFFDCWWRMLYAIVSSFFAGMRLWYWCQYTSSRVLFTI